jgi:asparagine N-glycosylation enzyme membrane subunit Stt3
MDKGSSEPLRVRDLKWFIVLPALAIIVAHGLIWVTHSDTSAGVTLRDTDSYMWMNRAIHLVETGDWFEHTYPRINPPAGHEQHWTRPVDAILIAGGAVLAPALGLREGMLLWGFIFPPLMHVLALVLLFWCVIPLVERGILERTAPPLAGLVFIALPPIYFAFLAGRPDHHAPLAVLFLLHVGLWLRVLLSRDNGLWPATALGLTAAVAIWVNVEALIYVTIGMLGLGLSWLAGNLHMARRTAAFGLALAAGGSVALLVEWGNRLPPVREMDTLSVAHVVLFALTAAFWILIWRFTDRPAAQSPVARTAVAGAGGVAVLALLALTFPEFFGSPLANVDPIYRETRLVHISELQSIGSVGNGPAQTVGVVILFVGAGILAVFYSIARSVQAPASEERILWLMFALGSLTFLLLSIPQVRWTDYLALSSVIPATALLIGLIGALSRRVHEGRVWIVRPLATAALIAGPLFAGAILSRSAGADAPGSDFRRSVEDQWWRADVDVMLVEGTETASNQVSGCDLREISDIIMDPEWFGMPTTILAHTDYGPELLFRTHHSVLSIPNHRYQPGYHLMREVFGNENPAVATRLMQQHDVGIVVLCLDDVASGFLRFPNEENTVLGRISRGMRLPGFHLHASTPSFRVYRAASGFRDGAELERGPEDA